MKILFLTHQIPNPYSGSTIRPYYIIKKFSESFEHKISLISFVTDSHKLYIDNITKYCEDTCFFPINDETTRSKLAIKTISSTFSPINIYSKMVSKNGVFDISYYNKKEIQKKIDRIIEVGNFDAIYSDAGMAGYVAKSPLPKIVEPLDTNSKNWLQYFIRSKSLFIKSYWLFRYLQTFYRESKIFKRFDFCVVVTNIDKQWLSKYISNVLVIPNGVDIDYFKPVPVECDHPSLVFVGMMNGEKNIEAVLYFYSNIFPCIKLKYPTVKFYIVGKNPHSKIYELGGDNSVIVTGFVEDMRPYIARCSIFICPMVSGSGIKNKVLEAMAMGMPVVSTSIGALGIDASFDKSIVISDDPEVFCEKIVELLSSEALRDKIGKTARKIMEDKYSWESTANNIDLLFKNMLQNCNN